jgi:tellurite resistance protein TerC
VLTSNVFAILSARHVLLAAVANKFHLLNYGLAVIRSSSAPDIA